MERSENEPQDHVKGPVLPRCPYCKTDKPEIMSQPQDYGGFLASMFYCGVPNCRKILGFGVVMVRPPQREDAMRHLVLPV